MTSPELTKQDCRVELMVAGMMHAEHPSVETLHELKIAAARYRREVIEAKDVSSNSEAFLAETSKHFMEEKR